MGLSVVARFSSLVEAEVASAALRAAGFYVQLFDTTFGRLYWTDQVAIGGFRVMVPEDEIADAVAYLDEIGRGGARRRPNPRDRGVAWRALALICGLLAVPLGWLIVGLHNRGGRGWPALACGIVLAGLIVTALFIATALALVILDHWLIHPNLPPR